MTTRRRAGMARAGMVLVALAGLETSMGAAQTPVTRPAAERQTVEYTTADFPYLSFEELKALSEGPMTPGLEAKLGRVLNGVIVSNHASGHASEARLPESREVGRVLRAVEWNIERGEQFEQVAETLSDDAGLTRAIAQRAAGEKKASRRTAVQTKLTKEAKLLEDADIVVLNEVDLGVTRSGYHDVSDELAKRLRMNSVFGVEFVEVDPLKLGTETITKEDAGGDADLEKELNDDLRPDPARYKGLHGSAVLTRLPVESGEMFRLPVCHDWFANETAETPVLEKAKRLGSHKIFMEKIDREVRRGGRMALLVRLKLAESPTGYVTVLATHLEAKTKPDCRRRQMDAILERLKEVRDPVILSGDFNTTGLDGSRLSVKYLVMSKVKDYRFWVRTSLMAGTPLPSFHLTKYFKNYSDPTTSDIKFLFDNKEAALFRDMQRLRFSDEERFDFRGMKSRSVNGRGKRLADSNERAWKGFAYTFSLPRDFKGLTGRSKLDWFVVKPVKACADEELKRGQVFSPYFGRTMMDLNRVYAEPSSDHAPILVDLRLGSDGTSNGCTATQ